MKQLLNSLVIVIFLVSCPALFAENKNVDDGVEKNAASEQKQTENLPLEKNPADTTPRTKNPIQKLKRGIVNVVTAPIEIAKGVDEGWKTSAEESKSASKGIFKGFFKGIVNTVGRTGSGLWDIISFPFETPTNYEPLMKPDYVLDDK